MWQSTKASSTARFVADSPPWSTRISPSSLFFLLIQTPNALTSESHVMKPFCRAKRPNSRFRSALLDIANLSREVNVIRGERRA
jgi:hypothetical protein